MSTRGSRTARVFITGSADGLGRAAAQTLLEQGHEVVVHARNGDRLTAVRDLLERGAAAVVGDLSDPEQTRGVADQVNRLGRMDAVIQNAGVLAGPNVLPVNVVAPYLLTALIHRPQRLVYLSSSMHRGGRASLTGMDWSGHRATGSYSDSKLFVITLAAAVGRIWTDVFSNAVDPGWVPTKMGGPGAPDDLRLGHLTPGVARHQRCSASAQLRRLLVSPAPRRAGPRRPRPAVPRPAARGAGSLHRHASPPPRSGPCAGDRVNPAYDFGFRDPDRSRFRSATGTTGLDKPWARLVSNQRPLACEAS